jgi:uncharacterized membrane protein YqhA
MIRLKIIITLLIVILVDVYHWFVRELKELNKPDECFYDEKDHWSGWG